MVHKNMSSTFNTFIKYQPISKFFH